jgi:dolichol-phosphate mannosyltransferase
LKKNNNTASGMRPRYSIVVPIYKDGDLADEFCLELDRVFREYLGTDDIAESTEVIFVNDGSPDNSTEALRKVCQKWRFARAVTLSRNFGQHVALSCGYEHARGEFVASLNVDMQDPLAEVVKLLDRIEKRDVDIVIGLRRHRRDSFSKHVTSVLFHYVLSKLTGYPIPTNMATVRVMNRQFVDAYNSLSEKSRFLPGLESWLGFRRGFVEIEHAERKVGKSSYNFTKRFVLALDSIISFSDLPLRMVVLVGSCIAVVGLLLTVALVIQKLFFVDLQAGYTSTVAIVVFLGGVQILVVGLASLYIGRILKEVQNRPLYVVEQRIGFESEKHAGSAGGSSLEAVDRRASQRGIG